MKKLFVGVTIVLSALAFSVSALELQSFTVDGSYWFGEANNFLCLEGGLPPGQHQSINVAGTVGLTPEVILGVDYTFSKIVNPETKNLDGVTIVNNRQLLSLSIGYSYNPVPNLDLVFSAGIGSFSDVLTQKEELSVSVGTEITSPQFKLAAQYKISPNLSFRAGYQIFLLNKGRITTDFLGIPISYAVKMRPQLFNLEANFLVKPSWEFALGYRVSKVPIKFELGDEFEEFDYDANGIYLGGRFSY